MIGCTFHQEQKAGSPGVYNYDGKRDTVPRCTEKGREGFCPFRGSFDLCPHNPENRLQEITDRFEAIHGEPRYLTTLKTG